MIEKEEENYIENDEALYNFGDIKVRIPEQSLSQVDLLRSIDLTYYLGQCRIALKKIYNKFKQDNSTSIKFMSANY